MLRDKGSRGSHGIWTRRDEILILALSRLTVPIFYELGWKSAKQVRRWYEGWKCPGRAKSESLRLEVVISLALLQYFQSFVTRSLQSRPLPHQFRVRVVDLVIGLHSIPVFRRDPSLSSYSRKLLSCSFDRRKTGVDGTQHRLRLTSHLVRVVKEWPIHCLGAVKPASSALVGRPLGSRRVLRACDLLPERVVGCMADCAICLEDLGVPAGKVHKALPTHFVSCAGRSMVRYVACDVS